MASLCGRPFWASPLWDMWVVPEDAATCLVWLSAAAAADYVTLGPVWLTLPQQTV